MADHPDPSRSERRTDPDKRPDSDVRPARDQTLLIALALYLGTTRNKSEVREAIHVWSHDVVNAGLQPERLLVDFKGLLDGMAVADRAPNILQRIADRREMITMCIEEYYR